MIAIVERQAVLEELRPRCRGVHERLDSLRSRVRRQLLLEGAAWTCGAACALAAASLAVDWLLRLSLTTRLVLLPLGVAAVLVVAVRSLLRPLRLSLDSMDLAVLIDRLQPGIAHRVATVLQLPGLLTNGYPVSASMVRAAVLAETSALERTDFAGTFNATRRWRFALLLGGSILIPLLFAAALPGIAQLWAWRWLLARDVRWPQRTYLAVVGLPDSGRLHVPRGEPLILKVNTQPELTAGAGRVGYLKGREKLLPIFRYSPAEPLTSEVPAQVALRYRAASGLRASATFTRFGNDDFRYKFPPVQEPLDVTITGGDDWLGPIVIEPVDRPRLEQIVLVARDPGRGEDETRTFEGTDSQLLFLRKTELELRLTSDLPLESASLAATTGTAPSLDRVDARQYVARWTMQEPLAMEIDLASDREHGGLRSKPYALSIGLLKDREPRVTVRPSGVGPRVTPQARIPLAVRANDDFGLAELGFELDQVAPTEPETGAEKKEPARTPLDKPDASETTEAARDATVALRDIGPMPGTLVKLRGLAADNSAEGSQTGFSRWVSFRVVKPEELFHEILMRQRAERAKFRAAHGTAKEQAEAMDTAVTPDAMDGMVRRHQVVERAVWQVANRLEASLVEMQLNELGSAQATELLQNRVITPMRELHSGRLADMRGLLDRMATAGDQLDSHLPGARNLQREITDEMQRILEQMSQWESFVDVVNQLREVIKLESGVIESTEEVRKVRTKGVFDE